MSNASFDEKLLALDGFRKLVRVMEAIWNNELHSWGPYGGDMALEAGFSIGLALKKFHEGER
jgi:hypothetical protein